MLVFRLLCAGGGLALALLGLSLFLTQLEGQLNRATNYKFSFSSTWHGLQDKWIFPSLMLVGLLGLFVGVVSQPRPWSGILLLAFGLLMLPFAWMMCRLIANFERTDDTPISRAAYQRMAVVVFPPVVILLGGVLHL